MVDIPGLSNVNWSGILGQAIYWIFWALLAFVIIAVFVAGYYYLTFSIKATIFPLYGSGKDGIFSIGKARTNKVKAIKKGNTWRSLFPILNKINREPFDAEYIYPGKRIYVFELNGEWIPGRVNINQTEGQIRSQINPVPYWVRNWADAEKRVNEVEMAQSDWWSENKTFVYMLITAGICAAMCLGTIYFTYKFATVGVQRMDFLTAAIDRATSANAPPG